MEASKLTALVPAIWLTAGVASVQPPTALLLLSYLTMLSTTFYACAAASKLMGPLSLFPGSYLFFNSRSRSWCSPNICPTSVTTPTYNRKNFDLIKLVSYLFGVMEVLNRVWNKVHLRDLVIFEDEIIALHDELSCQLFLAFAGVGSAPSTEQ